MKQPTVYILASRRNGTLYVGVTSDLTTRIWQHKCHTFEGFTSRHHMTRLVWFKIHDTMGGAIAREKTLKKWNRRWKLELIERCNPEWTELYDSLR